jgi:hypothetical protein
VRSVGLLFSLAAIIGAMPAMTGCEDLAPVPSDAGPGGGGQGGGTTSTASVECFLPVDCPGEDEDCVVRTCEEGACGVADLPLGTPTKNQAAGDCQRAVCDGQGHEVLVVDEADLPVDGDPCTDDVCTASVASNPPSGPGKPCDAGGVCNGFGACVECVASADCQSGMLCVNNQCM